MRVHKVLLLSCLSVSSVLAAFNFNNYPECAQSTCYEFAPPSCDFGNATDAESEQTDYCLCTNKGFVSDIAAQIFQICGCQVLTTSAQVFYDNCVNFQTSSVVSIEDFISLGDGGHTSCGSSGFDPGVIVGIVFGVLAVLLIIVIGVWELAVGVLGLLPEQYGPLPCIKRFFRCCCCYLPRRHPHRLGTIPLPPYSP
jgi:hypothetical protein